MEALMFVVALLTFMFGVWPLIGWIIVTTMNFISVYLKGERFFTKFNDLGGSPQIFFGPLLLVWIFYPLWLGIVYVVKKLRYQFGWKVVTFNVRVVDAEYQNKILKLCPTTTLCNFFKLYMEENQNARFLLRQENDNAALTNFLEIDGWRKVNDVLYTKIVRVKHLNKDFKDE